MDASSDATGPDVAGDDRAVLSGPARLEAAFGPDAIAPLLRGLRIQLIDAIAAIDESDGAARAHRIAGLAGTLGLDDLGRPWLAVSLGDASARAEALRRAEQVVAAIGRARR